MSETIDTLTDEAIAEDADGWRPIETAPKDGTAILIWQPSSERHDDKRFGGSYDDNRYAIGYWRTDQDPAIHKWMWGNRNAAFVTPTHWRPLPAPPKAQEAGE